VAADGAGDRSSGGRRPHHVPKPVVEDGGRARALRLRTSRRGSWHGEQEGLLNAAVRQGGRGGAAPRRIKRQDGTVRQVGDVMSRMCSSGRRGEQEELPGTAAWRSVVMAGPVMRMTLVFLFSILEWSDGAACWDRVVLTSVGVLMGPRKSNKFCRVTSLALGLQWPSEVT
jgi:hypothetical protein